MLDLSKLNTAIGLYWYRILDVLKIFCWSSHLFPSQARGRLWLFPLPPMGFSSCERREVVLGFLERVRLVGPPEELDLTPNPILEPGWLLLRPAAVVSLTRESQPVQEGRSAALPSFHITFRCPRIPGCNYKSWDHGFSHRAEKWAWLIM